MEAHTSPNRKRHTEPKRDKDTEMKKHCFKKKRLSRNISRNYNKGEETDRTEIPAVFAQDRLYLTAEHAKFKERHFGMDREQDKDRNRRA